MHIFLWIAEYSHIRITFQLSLQMGTCTQLQTLFVLFFTPTTEAQAAQTYTIICECSMCCIQCIRTHTRNCILRQFIWFKNRHWFCIYYITIYLYGFWATDTFRPNMIYLVSPHSHRKRQTFTLIQFAITDLKKRIYRHNFMNVHVDIFWHFLCMLK